MIVRYGRVLLLSIFFLTSGLADGEEYDIDTIKAVFLERFTRFIKWPEEVLNDKGPFVIAIAGQTPVEKKLKEVYRTRKILGLEVEIINIEEDPIPKCHILFIGELSEGELGRLLAASTGRPVLTVSDTRGFAQKGVRINFFSMDSRLRFEINESSIRSSGLNVSYLLLKQAKIIKAEKEP